MAISIKLKRSNSAESGNVFLVTAGSGDTGKLQIQLNGSDIYNNLSGSTPDILSGATNTNIYIPLGVDGEIEKGVYYFNFVASVGDSDTEYIDFQVTSIAPVITPDVDIYAPSYLALDDTNYTVDNGTVSAATRTMTVIYPSGSSQSNLTTSQSNTTTSMYISTSNVWTGAMQAQTTYDITWTIASTILGATTYSSFVYQELGSGYNSEIIEADNLLSDLYDCIERLRRQVRDAESSRRSDYATLLSKYQYVGALAVQFREAVITGNTETLEEIILKIKNLTGCSGSGSVNPSNASTRLYGINGTQGSGITAVTDGTTTVTPVGILTFSGATVSGSGGNATVTIESGAGTLTEVTGVSPISVASGTTTPQISISLADETTDGYLSSEDYAYFDAKQEALVSGTNIKTVNSTSLLGSGNVSVGVTSTTGVSPIVVASGTTTPQISVLEASSATTGVLTNTDWITFNNKQTLKTVIEDALTERAAIITDVDKCIYSTNVTSFDYTLTVEFDAATSIGDEILVVTNNTSGTVSSEEGVTLNGISPNSGAVLTRYKPTLIKKVATHTYVI